MSVNPRTLIEPAAKNQNWEAQEFETKNQTIVFPAEITLSAAISLKRIADALWGVEGTSGLLQLLNPLDVRNNY